MRVVELLAPERIVCDLSSINRALAIEETISRAHRTPEDMIAALQIRGDFLNCCQGRNVALPHAFLPELEAPIGFLGIHPQGITSSNITNRVQFFFVVLSPIRKDVCVPRMLHTVERIFDSSQFRKTLLKLRDTQEVWDVVAEREAVCQ